MFFTCLVYVLKSRTDELATGAKNSELEPGPEKVYFEILWPKSSQKYMSPYVYGI